MSATPEVVYCDDYEAITGQKAPVETKVVSAPEAPAPAPKTTAQTKGK